MDEAPKNIALQKNRKREKEKNRTLPISPAE